jgi:hypothetical protein
MQATRHPDLQERRGDEVSEGGHGTYAHASGRASADWRSRVRRCAQTAAVSWSAGGLPARRFGTRLAARAARPGGRSWRAARTGAIAAASAGKTLPRGRAASGDRFRSRSTSTSATAAGVSLQAKRRGDAGLVVGGAHPQPVSGDGTDFTGEGGGDDLLQLLQGRRPVRPLGPLGVVAARFVPAVTARRCGRSGLHGSTQPEV